MITLAIVTLLIAISALSSAAETAFLSASKARLTQRARQGEKRAITALNLISSPEHMLTTILLINTLVNSASSALTTAFLVERFGEMGVAYATVAMSALILVFAEALPKTFGNRYAEAITLAFAPAFRVLVRLCLPFIWVIRNLNRIVMMLLGLSRHNQPAFTENDIRGAINLGLEFGAIQRTEQRMLDAVLDLDDLTVADVMIHRSAIAALDIATDPSNLPSALGKLRHSRVPVYQGQPDNVVGILYVRDYLTALAAVANRSKVVLKDHLREPYYVPETTPVGHQLLEFLKHRRHLAMVVDEYGDVQGMISLEDILEEIVGDMADEKDGAVENMPAADGSILLAGRLPVRDANRRYGWQLPEDNAVTLAGLMVDKLHHLPGQGESVIVAGQVLTVASKRGHRIEKVHVAPFKSTPPPSSL